MNSKYKSDNPISNLIRDLVSDFMLEPEEINNGWCNIFAIRLSEKLNDAIPVWLHDIDERYHVHPHSVIKYEEKYYDAECPEGVETIEQLPFVQKKYLIGE